MVCGSDDIDNFYKSGCFIFIWAPETRFDFLKWSSCPTLMAKVVWTYVSTMNFYLIHITSVLE